MKPAPPRRAVVAGALLALALMLACRVDNVPTGPAALLFAATAVAGTAVYREATGGCWAACNTGWVCNPDTGLCEPTAREPERRLLRPAARANAAERSDVHPSDAGTAQPSENPDATSSEPAAPI